MESPFIFLALIDHFPFSVPIPVVHNFQPRYWYMDITVGKAMPLLFNKLSRLVITFLPRSKHLLIHGCCHHLQWFGAPQNKISHCFHYSSIYFSWSDWDWMPWSLLFEYWVLSQLFHSPLSLSSRGSFCLSSLSAIRVVSLAYLRLLIFLPAIWIPTCD